MRKAFIGPVGDDIPSILIIIMALTLFFSGIVFTLDVYNQKVDTINYLTAAVDIGRVVAGYGGINTLTESSQKAVFVSTSYGLKYDVSFGDEAGIYYTDGKLEEACSRNPFVFDYLVAVDGDLKVLKIRVCH